MDSRLGERRKRPSIPPDRLFRPPDESWCRAGEGSRWPPEDDPNTAVLIVAAKDSTAGIPLRVDPHDRLLLGVGSGAHEAGAAAGDGVDATQGEVREGSKVPEGPVGVILVSAPGPDTAGDGGGRGGGGGGGGAACCVILPGVPSPIVCLRSSSARSRLRSSDILCCTFAAASISFTPKMMPAFVRPCRLQKPAGSVGETRPCNSNGLFRAYIIFQERAKSYGKCIKKKNLP